MQILCAEVVIRGRLRILDVKAQIAELNALGPRRSDVSVFTLVDRLVEYTRMLMNLNDVLALEHFKVEKIIQALEVPEGTFSPEDRKS